MFSPVGDGLSDPALSGRTNLSVSNYFVAPVHADLVGFFLVRKLVVEKNSTTTGGRARQNDRDGDRKRKSRRDRCVVVSF